MGRWEPNARGRLEQAAMELYAERGFENTTVAEIAQRAGLTERSFFRYFADKREVLFYGSGALQEFLLREVKEASPSLSPIELIVSALVEASTEIFEERRKFARRRQAIIAANPQLQERELIKLANLASALGAALAERGVGEPAASFAAEAGVSVFKVAFQRWVDDAEVQTLAVIIQQVTRQLQAVTNG